MNFLKIFQAHTERYPSWQVQDVYKLAYQAALGPGHSIRNPSSAREWLERELAAMGKGPTEPVIDPISTNEEIVRVHLRPYLAYGGDPEMLLSAFVDTANHYHGETELLEAYLAQIVDHQHFPPEKMEDFFQKIKEQGYPGVHHSETYRKLYRPAYRVVGRKYLPNSINWDQTG